MWRWLMLWCSMCGAAFADPGLDVGSREPSEVVARMREHLGLSPAQASAVEVSLTEAQGAIRDLKAELAALEVDARLHREAGRTRKAERLIRKMADLRAEVVIIGLRTRDEVMALLAPEQAAALARYLDRRRARGVGSEGW